MLLRTSKLCSFAIVAMVSLFIGASWAATRGASVITQTSKTTIRQKVEPTGLYDEACYNTYFGCMDQFCISGNESGGSCVCSEDYDQKYSVNMKQIEANTNEANRLTTIEVEKIKAGANADILFTGERKYDADGNVITIADADKQSKSHTSRADLEKMMSSGDEEDQSMPVGDLTGKDLYNKAQELCLEKMPQNCSGDMDMLQQVYLTQIKNDCTALSANISDLLKKSQMAIADAQKDVVAARTEMNAKVNEFDRGTCMVEFKKCMKTDDACGSDWARCVSSVASENMQNDAAVSTRGTTVAHTEKFDITDSVLEMLSSKRNICESVLDKCMANRDNVWNDFLRDVAPELKVATTSVESKMRGSCLTDISNCIQTACKDDIEGKGTATMDSCLARPDMARSFCKTQIDPCERMEPQIWDYVVSKLAALRVDVCTKEVKDCFTSDDRCGSDFSKCIGMDYNFMHEMCPIDKLVVCKQSKTDFKMSDIDGMLMGFYLNVDNSALDLCQAKIDKKLNEVCGSTVDCNKFAADDTMGTGSLQSVKLGNIYTISGMLSMGMIKMGDGKLCDGGEEDCSKQDILPVGQIGVKDYVAELRKKYPGAGDKATVDMIEMELNNIAGTINRTIAVIESDPDIQFCISGRDLSQINGQGTRNNKTTARFPNLLNNPKQMIGAAALRKAQDNYNKKYTDMVSKATKEATADIAQYLCNQMGANGTSAGKVDAGPDLIPPYAIKIEIGKGLGLTELLGGNSAVLNTNSGSASTTDKQAGISLTNIGFRSSGTSSSGGVTTNTRSLFNRDTRVCHYCKETSTTSCESSKSSGFFGIGAKSSSSCDVKSSGEKCEDVTM